MGTSKTIFIDANYFCGLYNSKDTLNQKSINSSKVLKEKGYKSYVSSYIVVEAMTILSQRVGKNIAILFWEKINNGTIDIIYLDKKLQFESFAIFEKIKNKNISFVDASILALMKKYKINYLLTFDKQLIKEAKKLGIEAL